MTRMLIELRAGVFAGYAREYHDGSIEWETLEPAPARSERPFETLTDAVREWLRIHSPASTV